MKKMIFNFYLNKKYEDSPINKIHFKCIENYIKIFDYVLFNLTIDSYSPENLKMVNSFKKWALNLNYEKDIEFKVRLNTIYCESKTFHDEISEKLQEENGNIIFFGHNKGITNIEEFKFEDISTWVVGLYYYSLNFIDEVVQELYHNCKLTYGPFLTKNEYYGTNKYGWIYNGCFSWVNPGFLYEYIKNNNINLPLLCNRHYQENFYANIFEAWPAPLASSHSYYYYNGAVLLYTHTLEKMSYIGADTEDFKKFLNNILESIKYDE